MSAEERKQILHMLEDGKITPKQALELIKELESETSEDEAGHSSRFIDRCVTVIGEASKSFGEALSTPTTELEKIANRAHGLWQFPLWVGVSLVVASAIGMYAIVQKAAYNFLFHCLWLPLLLGVGLIALAGWSRMAHWLFVNIDRPRGLDEPRRISLRFPLPLGLTSWIVGTFGRRMRELSDANIDEIVHAISIANSMEEPLIVDVDDGEGGERVQVYIG